MSHIYRHYETDSDSEDEVLKLPPKASSALQKALSAISLDDARRKGLTDQDYQELMKILESLK